MTSKLFGINRTGKDTHAVQGGTSEKKRKDQFMTNGNIINISLALEFLLCLELEYCKIYEQCLWESAPTLMLDHGDIITIISTDPNSCQLKDTVIPSLPFQVSMS